MTTWIALLCVIGIACGQILFKLCARAFQDHGMLAVQTIWLFTAAMSLYGITTLAWIWVLSKSELGRVYPLMALAFVLVPIASYFLFGERYNLPYTIGIVMIVTGIFLTSQG